MNADNLTMLCRDVMLKNVSLQRQFTPSCKVQGFCFCHVMLVALYVPPALSMVATQPLFVLRTPVVNVRDGGSAKAPLRGRRRSAQG